MKFRERRTHGGDTQIFAALAGNAGSTLRSIQINRA
jgi:hypothetical protein